VQQAGAAGKDVRDQIAAAAERDLIELVIDAVRSVLGEYASSDPMLVMRTVERAIERLGGQNVVRVRVHPDETETVTAALGERDGTAATWEVLADGTVSIGGCVIDTTAGEVDARLDVQLDAIARVLREAVPDAG
jgi:flagellar assembly protein FliH